MQQLESKVGNTSWRQSSFEMIIEKGIHLNVNFPRNVNSDDIVNDVVISEDDMKDEIVFWDSIIVFYVLVIKLPF